MRTTARTLALALAVAAPALAPAAFAQRLLWSAAPAGAALPLDPTPAPWSVELADDFDAWGEVAGVAIAGAGCDGCAPAAVSAVELRFWSPAPGGGPGALEAEYRLPAGDDHLKIDPAHPAALEIRLATPFAARGRHFVSLRVEFAGAGSWSWHLSRDPRRFEPAWERDGGSWRPAGAALGAETDLAFDLTSSRWDGLDLARGCGRFELEAPAWPAGISAWRFLDVATLDAERALAVGVGKAAEGERALVFERRRGVWRQLAPDLAAGARLLAVEAMPWGEFWLVGSETPPAGSPVGGRRPLLLAYQPERESWERHALPALGTAEGELNALTVHREREVWLVGTATETVDGARRESALLVRSTGSGFERHELEPVTSSGESLAAVASDGEAVWAVGGGAARGQSPLVARWEGRAWTRVAAWGLDRAGLLLAVAARPGELWIGGVTLADDPLLVSFDGSRWDSHPSPVGGRALAVPEKEPALTAGAGLASFGKDGWIVEPALRELLLEGLAAPGGCAAFAAGAQSAQGSERGLVLRLVREGFGDGFESGGLEAWSFASGAPAD